MLISGITIREFEVTVESNTLQLNSAITFIGWNLNDRIAVSTFRVTEGDRVRFIFHNEDGHSHSLHFHGIHPVEELYIKPPDAPIKEPSEIYSLVSQIEFNK